MSTRQRCLIINLNRALIFTLSMTGLLMDGFQPPDLPCSLALMVWLWLPQCARAEVNLLGWFDSKIGHLTDTAGHRHQHTQEAFTMKYVMHKLMAVFVLSAAAATGHAALPDPGMPVEKGRTALVVTDPQNDFLSPKGVAWGVVGKSVEANNTVANLEALFSAARANGIPVFVSPHYYYPHDHRWKFEGALETLMHRIGMFDRKGPLSVEGLEGSGADWLERYKPYINDVNTTVTSPHKVYGPETNDLVLQLRKRGIGKVILAGMSANLCTESHMRELLEQGFEVAVVSDATAAAQVEEGDGYAAALVNFRYMANALWTTREAVEAMQTR